MVDPTRHKTSWPDDLVQEDTGNTGPAVVKCLRGGVCPAVDVFDLR